MSTPLTISLLYEGRQKDYEAIFTSHPPTCEFKVFIDDAIVNFEGSMQEPFILKRETPNKPIPHINASIIEAVQQQLNQIFL